MIKVRRANERGRSKFDWLDSSHTFSFAEYYDEAHMNFHALRVINDDRVVAGAGFPTHGHRDMEIITLVLDGALEHKDSLGTGEVLRPGEVQVMSAGTGIQHSEFNPSSTAPAHFIQIWIMPEKRGLKPRYAQRAFAKQDRMNEFVRVAGAATKPGEVEDDALPIYQDANLFLANITKDSSLRFMSTRPLWIHVATGSEGIRVEGQTLVAGDGASVEDHNGITLIGVGDETEVLVFEL